MYFSLGDYIDFYRHIINNEIPSNCIEEYGKYQNSLYQLITPFELFKDEYDNKNSSKYMENVFRLLTRYNIDDNIINKSLIDIVVRKHHNLDLFFYTIYSILKPKEMERISLSEYITDFYQLLLTNYGYTYNVEDKEEIIKDINIEKFRDLLLHVNRANIPRIFNDNFFPKLFLLAIIMSNIYLNNLDYKLIDTYLDNTEYYYNKLILNGIISKEDNNSIDFLASFHLKDLFYNINTFINDNHKDKKLIK